MLSKQVISKLLLAAIALVATVACGAEEAAEPAAPEQPAAARAAEDAAVPQAPTGQTGAAKSAAQPKGATGEVAKAADPAKPKAGEAAMAAAPAAAPKGAQAAADPQAAMVRKTTRTGPTGTALDLHDTQTLTMPGYGVGYGNAPWRDGGGNSEFGEAVYGTLLVLNPKNELLPWLAASWESNDTFDVWTFKLREDAVYQDGTPFTAADVKAYWEHGAKPENIIAWGGTSLYLADVKGWGELRGGDVTVSEGLVVIDDHTLQVNLGRSYPTWATHVAAFNAGFSKLDQVLSEEEWWTHPIGVGPYSLVGDPDTGNKVLTRVEIAGGQWWGGDSIIDKMFLPVVPDNQVKVIMMENGELDILVLDDPTWAAASADPGHPFHNLLRPIGNAGLWYMQPNISLAPMQDVFVRRALAHGADMQTIISAVMGPLTKKATGILSPTLPCGNPAALGHVYDPDLARQELAESSYGSGQNLPVINIDLARPEIINMTAAVKEYWKDNLGAVLDILRRERGMPRRDGSQLRRFSGGAIFPDELQLLDQFTRKDIGVLAGGDPSEFVVLDSLVAHARSLPMDHPDRCLAYDAVSQEYMSRVFMIPFHWDLIKRWAVQPWVKGFQTHLYGNVPVYDMYIQAH